MYKTGASLLSLACLMIVGCGDAQTPYPDGGCVGSKCDDPTPSTGFLNGGRTIINNYGLLFSENPWEEVAYAASLNTGVIRVWGIVPNDPRDSNGDPTAEGDAMAERIAAIAGALENHGIQLLFTFASYNLQVPGEDGDAVFVDGDGHRHRRAGWYDQAADDPEDPYRVYVRAVIRGVKDRQVARHVFSWQLINEANAQFPHGGDIWAFKRFVGSVSKEIRSIAPNSRISIGSMGMNHFDPGNRNSELAKAVYCSVRDVDYITLHTYDFVVAGDHVKAAGDMPIHWDLDFLAAQDQACRSKPVVVEELGFSKGLHGSDDERVDRELAAMEYLLGRGVSGIGAWGGTANAHSRYGDSYRGLGSYDRSADPYLRLTDHLRRLGR